MTAVTIQSLIKTYEDCRAQLLLGKRTVSSMSAVERAGNLLVVHRDIDVALQSVENMIRVWPKLEEKWSEVRDVLLEAKSARDNAMNDHHIN